MSRHPLVAHRNLGDAVAYRRGAPVTVGRFLADVDRIAAEFPAGQYVLNACTDRYRFAVGLAAALVIGKVSLLPASLAPETVRQLRKVHPDLFCLTDNDHPVLDLPQMRYRDAVAITVISHLGSKAQARGCQRSLGQWWMFARRFRAP